MKKKLKTILNGDNLDKMLVLKTLLTTAVEDYDRSLATYAQLNDDKTFSKVSKEVDEMMNRRLKLSNILQTLNKRIENLVIDCYDGIDGES
mgnify:CR=1 FL=1